VSRAGGPERMDHWDGKSRLGRNQGAVVTVSK
jgi:hypothetical protein